MQKLGNIGCKSTAQLASGDWINRAQNLLVTGPCGSVFFVPVHCTQVHFHAAIASDIELVRGK